MRCDAMRRGAMWCISRASRMHLVRGARLAQEEPTRADSAPAAAAAAVDAREPVLWGRDGGASLPETWCRLHSAPPHETLATPPSMRHSA
eukprot:CAMPEP_0183341684 /NCGR_PEP_ID=MMETSP0164_2-20130417/7931_1 /TAXON_ID=221442 /ORGANISM="Coccolithus pelagicus ssp braarudi, Strain PLY182g" /LENGTH=89 /DNA_ID=CAMNT_0025512083 /DNA_START=186 /DNA_END=452 /DNA_ORIENTATION=-